MGQGPVAARGAVEAAAAAGSRKKVAAAVAELDAAHFSVPVRLRLGADLQLDAAKITGCSVADGLTCDVVAVTRIPSEASEFSLTCATTWGASKPMTFVAATAEPGHIALRVDDLLACLDFGDHLRIEPVAHMELDGMGAGDEYMAPELVGLTWDQVKETLDEQLTSFQYCPRKLDLSATGKLDVAFHIGPDGQFDKVEAASSTVDEPAVVACYWSGSNASCSQTPTTGLRPGATPSSSKAPNGGGALAPCRWGPRDGCGRRLQAAGSRGAPRPLRSLAG